MDTTPATIEHTELIVPRDRQRQLFAEEALIELGDDIIAHGLYHAILVRSDGVTLVAGERRARAIKRFLIDKGLCVVYNGETLPFGHIPVVKVASEDALDLMEIELHENLKRQNLTWQEMAQTTAQLDELRRGQALKKAAAMGLNLPVAEGRKLHTVADTAREVRGSAVGEAQTTTRNEILVAAHLDKPEVANAPTLKDAFKALKKIEDAGRNAALAAAVGETYSAAQHKLFNGDCLELMSQWVESGEFKFDVICTDPPYGMNAQDFGDGASRMTNIDHQYDDSYESWLSLMNHWTVLSYRVTKPQAHAYVWCDFDRFHELKRMMETAGWYVFRTPLINYKRNSGRVPLPDQGPRRQYEICLYAIKGKMLVNAIYSDVITTDSDEQMTHGAQKPVALYEDLLKRSVKPGMLLLDSFSGTGPLLPAATALKCYAVVIEKNPVYFGLNVQRVEQLTAQQELPV